MAVVSIIIPTYNHRDYVLQALDSVFAQIFTDFEVIVVNDGSPDDTAQVLRPLIESNKIRYIEQPNAGQAIARNRGLEMAQGEFVAFLDDDDLWPPDKLAWQVEALREQHDLCAVVGDVTKEMPVPERTKATGASWRMKYQDLFYGNIFLSPGQFLIRTADLKEVGGLNPKIWGLDDFDLYIRLALRKPILVVPRLALFYRFHQANASRQRERMFINSALCLRLRLRDVPWRLRWSMARRGYRWLYDYLGREMLRQEGPSGSNRFLARVKRTVWVLRHFGLVCIVDPRLFFNVWSDLWQLYPKRAS